MQSVPFQPIDMSEYLVQPDSNEVSWMIVNNPNLNAYFVGSILYVQGTSGFLGQTNLIVMASEISSRAYEESRGESSRNVAQAQVAETSIQFTVTPFYWLHYGSQNTISKALWWEISFNLLNFPILRINTMALSLNTVIAL